MNSQNTDSPKFSSKWLWLILAAALACYLPFLLTERSIFGLRLSNMQLLNLGLTQVNLMLIAMLGSLSLNYLTGNAGLISIGHAAFYAVGAMTGAVAGTQWGWPFPLVLVLAGFVGAIAGLIAGLPSLRVRGLYFVLSTFAMHYIVSFSFLEYQFKFFDVVGVPYEIAKLGSFEINTPMRWYFLLLPVVVLVYFGLKNTMSTREGRVMMAMRDHELATTSVGADVRILRLKAFAFSSAIASVAGAIYAFYMSNVNAESFGIQFAIQFIAMIIIGGMGSLNGALVGAALWLLLPSIIAGFASQVTGSEGAIKFLLVDNRAQFVQAIFGSLVIVLLIFAPGGIVGIGAQIRNRLAAKTGQS